MSGRQTEDTAHESRKKTKDDIYISRFSYVRDNGTDSFLKEWNAIECLGQGTYGTVFKAVKGSGTARQTSAIKLIESESIASIRKFAQELESLNAMQNCRNIVHIEDSAVITCRTGNGSRYYLALRMELLKPIPPCSKDSKWTEKNVLRLAYDICSALIYCHNRKHPMIHCDIKPDNILMDDNGNYLLTDFGEVLQLRYTLINGTIRRGSPSYMSPEVIEGRTIDTRSDIYSLGSTMYALLNSGVSPRMEILRRGKAGASDEERDAEKTQSYKSIPKLKGVSRRLMSVIERMCSYDRNERFQSVEEVMRALNSPVKKRRNARGGGNAASKMLKAFAVAAALCMVLVFAAALAFNIVKAEKDIVVSNNYEASESAVEAPRERPQLIETSAAPEYGLAELAEYQGENADIINVDALIEKAKHQRSEKYSKMKETELTEYDGVFSSKEYGYNNY